jgi:hypothetical protein
MSDKKSGLRLQMAGLLIWLLFNMQGNKNLGVDILTFDICSFFAELVQGNWLPANLRN